MGREVTRTHAEDPDVDTRPAVPRHIEPAQRIWFHDGGKPMFGPGTLRLLVLVTQTGSLHEAAKRMGMAYSKAWRIVKEAEDHLGFKLLERRIGGAGGGGSSLTEEARTLVARFVAMRAEADAHLHRLFDKYFGKGPTAAPRDPE